MRWLATVLIFILLLAGCKNPEPDPNIIFSPRAFYQNSTIGFVYVAGTLTGEDIGYPNNSTVIACYADRRECVTYAVDQIGHMQIGRLEQPNFFPITKWDEVEVVAGGQSDAVSCNKVTINIVLKSETALWVTEPINQSKALCKNASTKILKWTLEDSPGWKAVFKK